MERAAREFMPMFRKYLQSSAASLFERKPLPSWVELLVKKHALMEIAAADHTTKHTPWSGRPVSPVLFELPKAMTKMNLNLKAASQVLETAGNLTA